MKFIKNLAGGLAGAFALNLLHETVRLFYKGAPHIHEVGKEGVNKLLEADGGEPLEGKPLYAAALLSDVISNAVFYSLIGRAKTKNLLYTGAAFGVAAGIGALTLTEKIGLDDEPINETKTKSLMTIGYYLTGGIIAALAIKALRSK